MALSNKLVALYILHGVNSRSAKCKYIILRVPIKISSLARSINQEPKSITTLMKHRGAQNAQTIKHPYIYIYIYLERLQLVHAVLHLISSLFQLQYGLLRRHALDFVASLLFAVLVRLSREHFAFHVGFLYEHRSVEIIGTQLFTRTPQFTLE